jgi:tight adherence protein B
VSEHFVLKWLIPLLFTVSFGGLSYVFLVAFTSGAEAYSGAFSEDTSREFEDVFLFIPPRRIAEASWALAIAVFIGFFMLTAKFDSLRGVVVGVLVGSIFGALALHIPKFLLSFLKKRRLLRFNLQLVDTLVSMSNALKAGFSITQAFEHVVREGENPIAQEFDVCLQETRVGVSFSDSLSHLQQRVASEDLSLVVLSIETARKTGGNLTEIFETISATIRQRMQIENRIRTLTSQGKMQGAVAACMPLVIGMAMMIIEPEMMRPFLHSPMGIGLVVLMCILITLGWLVIRKIVDIDV